MTTSRNIRLWSLAFAVTAFALAACGARDVAPAPSSALQPSRVPFSIGKGKITHVVIVIQENRSFDNLFQGYPGADTRSYGYASNGSKIQLQPISLATKWDLEHSFDGFLTSCNGTGTYPGTNCKMNGFDRETNTCYTACPIQYPPYAYVPQSESKPYFAMAQQYVLGDRMFASNLDESSFIAHQYLIAAQASSAVNYPNSNDWGCYGPPGDIIHLLSQQRMVEYDKKISACFDNETLGDELDTAGISWRYYTGAISGGSGHLWSAYSAIKHIYEGPDWSKDVIAPQSQFLTDVASGTLASVTWITPTCPNSDHASCNSNTGPDWVASVVNSIGQSKFWDSTAIFITWDDPGGWYDHVAPKMLDYDGLGFRVPLLIISPYAKQAYVTHVHYELGSILHFVENLFGLKTLSASDARATSPARDAFNFLQSPRPFQVITTGRNKNYFLHQPPDNRPPDTN